MESRTLHTAMNGSGPHGPAPGSTPTLCDLPRRFADFADLGEALDYAARGQRGFNFYDARADLAHAVSFAELRDCALADAARLRAAGVTVGDRVALIAETSPAFASLFLGAVLAGAWPVPLPLPTSFGGRETYVAQIANQIASSDPAIVLAPADLMDFVRDAAPAGLKAMDWETFRASTPAPIEPHRPRPDDVAYLQYSSGSTRFPHGVMVTHRALLANLRCHSLGMAIQWDDRVVSWLPMYHDMGLVGCFLSPLANQISTDYLATEDFTRRPLSWLTLISRNTGCTVSYSPTFGYDICARRVGQGTHSTRFDLARWRIAGNGADMIRPEVMQAFTDSFAPSGFDPHAFLPSYGLAEATLAVSLMPPGEGIVIDEVDERQLSGELDDHAPGHRARVRKIVNCGRPVLDHRVEIRSEGDEVLADRGIGAHFLPGTKRDGGLFPRRGCVRRRAQGWVARYRRHGVSEGRLCLHRRPRQGHDHHQRSQLLAPRYRMGDRAVARLQIGRHRRLFDHASRRARGRGRARAVPHQRSSRAHGAARRDPREGARADGDEQLGRTGRAAHVAAHEFGEAEPGQGAVHVPGGDDPAAERGGVNARVGLVLLALLGAAPAPPQVMLAPGEPPALVNGRSTARFLIESAATGGAWSMAELAELPGFKTTLHRHPNWDEAFYVLEGVLSVHVGGATRDFGPGGFVVVPRGTPHGQANFGGTRVRFLLAMQPGGFERHLRDRVPLAREIAPDSAQWPTRVAALRAKNRDLIEELGTWER